MTMTTSRFTRTQRVLHWVSALLVLGLFSSGMAYFLEIADDEILIGHQIVGQVLIVLLLWRLWAKRGEGPVVNDHAPWERLLARLVQIGLYGLLIAYVVTGYVAASALRDNMLVLPLGLGFARSGLGETLVEVHYALKWALVGLLVLHIGGALKHALIDRDGTFANIWFGKGKGDI